MNAFISNNLNLMNSQGYCVIPNTIPNNKIDHIREKVVESGISRIDGMLNIVPDLQILCENFSVLGTLQALMGNDICLANALSIKHSPPGFEGGSLHIDNDISEISKTVDIPFWHAVQVLWALDNTTVDNGATRVVPFSHHARVDPTQFGYTKTMQCEHEYPVCVKKGSAIVLHALLWHGGGPNTTEESRYVVSGYFTLPKFYDKIITCLGAWPEMKTDVFKTLSSVVKDMTQLGLEAGRGGR